MSFATCCAVVTQSAAGCPRGGTARSTSLWSWRCSRCCSAPAGLRQRTQPRAGARDRVRVGVQAGRDADVGRFVWLSLTLWHRSRPLQSAAGTGRRVSAIGVLGALAMFILPHQFHVAVMECTRRSRRAHRTLAMFPLYLVLIALPDLAAGAWPATELLGNGVPTPICMRWRCRFRGRRGVALLAFLGGLSAATGMVVVTTLTLSVMICNHWLTPGSAGGAWSNTAKGRRPALAAPVAGAPCRHSGADVAGLGV